MNQIQRPKLGVTLYSFTPLFHGREFALDDIGIAQLERPKWHIDCVTSHIAQSAGAEVEPTSPVESMVDTFFEWPFLSRPEPDIPVECRGYWRRV